MQPWAPAAWLKACTTGPAAPSGTGGAVPSCTPFGPTEMVVPAIVRSLTMTCADVDAPPGRASAWLHPVASTPATWRSPGMVKSWTSASAATRAAPAWGSGPRVSWPSTTPCIPSGRDEALRVASSAGLVMPAPPPIWPA